MNSQLNGQQVILRLKERDREGWLVMTLDEFLRAMDLDAWSADQQLIGIVVPSRQGTLN